MDEFREGIPTLTGPGAFLITLIFLGALAISEGRVWVFSNGIVIVGLVTLSLPLSVFITQVYHAYNRKWGFSRPYITKIRDEGKKDWKEFSSDPYVLDARLDFLTLRCNHEDNLKACLNLIRKHAASYSLSIMLTWTSGIFAIGYVIFIFWLFSQDSLCVRQLVWPIFLIVFSVILAVLFWESSSGPREALEKLEDDILNILEEEWKSTDA